jgi:hypothetical protein
MTCRNRAPLFCDILGNWGGGLFESETEKEENKLEQTTTTQKCEGFVGGRVKREGEVEGEGEVEEEEEEEEVEEETEVEEEVLVVVVAVVVVLLELCG